MRQRGDTTLQVFDLPPGARVFKRMTPFRSNGYVNTQTGRLRLLRGKSDGNLGKVFSFRWVLTLAAFFSNRMDKSENTFITVPLRL